MLNTLRPVMVALSLLLCCAMAACHNQPVSETPHPKKDYIKAIPGKSDSIPLAIIDKGKVLIAYSDCYNCHKEDERFIGPAFTDIAKRYPANQQYINALAYKVISGGSRNWGYPVMDPHPGLSHDDAMVMVSYVLSLR